MELEECIAATCKANRNTWIRFPKGLPIDGDKLAKALECPRLNGGFIDFQIQKNKTRDWYLRYTGYNNFQGDLCRYSGDPFIKFKWDVNRELGEL